MPRVVLVTGGAGFVGGHLLEHLSPVGPIVAWSRSDPPPMLAAHATWERVDLLDHDQVRQAVARLSPTHVYHLAGVTHVGDSWQDPTAVLAGNILATHHLFDALHRQGGPCRVLLAGSAAVYAPADSAVTEEHRLAPASPYAVSKMAQEQLGSRAVAEDGLDVVLTRSFNHTGPRQRPNFAAPGMARQVALIERGDLEPAIKVGNLAARRDLSDVRDVVRAYALLMENGTPGSVYNVASGTATPIQHLLDALVSRSRVPVRVEMDPSLLRPSDAPLFLGDASKLRRTTGWKPDISFDQMLDDLLDYWRRH